jgi:uncharacterized protein (DUF488 family)
MRQTMIEIMTIGYEGLKRADFFGMLERCGVTMLVDVRELPISRKRGFSKSALKADIENLGLQYEHIGELGCPRETRHAYRDDGDWERYTRRFKQYLETQFEALNRLKGWVERNVCCLMCFEEDYNFCHRSFVADKVATLVDDHVKISHLTGPIQGRVVVHRLQAA